VLMQRQSLATTAHDHGLGIPAASDKLLAGLEKLRGVRGRRPRPHLDDKILTAWNGLMISALAKGARLLGDQSYLATATRAAEFVHHELYDAASGIVYRSWRDPSSGLGAGGRSNIQGFAEDYAFLIQGLLDLYEAGFDVRWLQWAEQLQATMDRLFEDRERGGYFNSRADDPTVIVRLKEDHDGAEPSANSVAVLNLLRLDAMVGNDGSGGTPPSSYRDRALKTILALRPQWSAVPHSLPQLLGAFELAMDAPRTVVLAGDRDATDFRALLSTLDEKLGPRRAVVWADAGPGQKWLATRRPYLAEMKAIDGRATAYVCENFACQAPVTDPAELRRLLD
jgi:uncharacterized protein YyaL (SSP411 family)